MLRRKHAPETAQLVAFLSQGLEELRSLEEVEHLALLERPRRPAVQRVQYLETKVGKIWQTLAFKLFGAKIGKAKCVCNAQFQRT